MTQHSAVSTQSTAASSYLSDEALDLAILRELFPEQQKTGIQLSVDVANSGGAIRTGIRLEDLLERRLVFLCYEPRGSESAYWRLTVRGKWEVQKSNGEVAVGGKQ